MEDDKEDKDLENFKKRESNIEKEWFKYQKKNYLFHLEWATEEWREKYILKLMCKTKLLYNKHLRFYGLYHYNAPKNEWPIANQLETLVLIAFDKPTKISEKNFNILDKHMNQHPFNPYSNDLLLLRCGLFPLKDCTFLKKNEIYNENYPEETITKEEKEIENFIKLNKVK